MYVQYYTSIMFNVYVFNVSNVRYVHVCARCHVCEVCMYVISCIYVMYGAKRVVNELSHHTGV